MTQSNLNESRPSSPSEKVPSKTKTLHLWPAVLSLLAQYESELKEAQRAETPDTDPVFYDMSYFVEENKALKRDLKKERTQRGIRIKENKIEWDSLLKRIF